MTMMKNVLRLALAAASVSCAVAAFAFEPLDRNLGSAFVRQFYDQNGYEEDKINEIKTTMVLPFKWKDASGKEYVVFSTPAQFGCPCHWSLMEISRDGGTNVCRRAAGDLRFEEEGVFRAQYGDGRDEVILCFDQSRWDEIRCDVFALEDIRLRRLCIETNWTLASAEIKGGLPEILLDGKLETIGSVFHYGYMYPEAKPLALIYNRPPPVIYRDESVPSARKKELAGQYLGWLREKGVAEKGVSAAVFMVFCDADGDGTKDAYVSSSLDRVDGDDYRWTLYCGTPLGFARRSGRIVQYRELEEAVVNPEVIAPKDAFFEVLRADFRPYVAAIVRTENGVSSWSYLHNRGLLWQRRKEEGVPGLALRICIPPGQHGETDVRDWFADFSYAYAHVRLLRLPCEEFPEE